MAYFDINKTAGTDTAADARSVLDRLVKFIAASVPARPGKSPQDILAARHRAEAHRRAVDRLMR